MIANEVKVAIRHNGEKFQAKQENLGQQMVELLD